MGGDIIGGVIVSQMNDLDRDNLSNLLVAIASVALCRDFCL
jgi:hypothetical protein